MPDETSETHTVEGVTYPYLRQFSDEEKDPTESDADGGLEYDGIRHVYAGGGGHFADGSGGSPDRRGESR